MFYQKKFLFDRMVSEIQYLRDQNKILMDRLLAVTNRTAYQETKYQEKQERQELIELEKYRGMTSEQIKLQVEKDKKEDDIVAIQLKQMVGG